MERKRKKENEAKRKKKEIRKRKSAEFGPEKRTTFFTHFAIGDKETVKRDPFALSLFGLRSSRGHPRDFRLDLPPLRPLPLFLLPWLWIKCLKVMRA